MVGKTITQTVTSLKNTMIVKNLKLRLEGIGKIPLCNMKKERAPQIFGFVFPLCYRCIGLIMGGLLGSIMYNNGILNQKNNWIFISILSLPFLLDTLAQKIFKKDSTNTKRLLTGVLFGIALANFRPF